jgi:hypothetical protein
MVNKNIISEVLKYLEDIGWSELICSRWRKDVINDIKKEFPNIDDGTLEYILKIILV